MFHLVRDLWQRMIARLTHDPTERRQWARLPSGARTQCQSAQESDSRELPSEVRDVSPGGINLLVSWRWELGTLLHVDLPAAVPPCRLLACVVHATAAGANRWSLGCSFIRELTYEEVRLFARAPTDKGRGQAPGPGVADRKNVKPR
jgi:hypothetical protein